MKNSMAKFCYKNRQIFKQKKTYLRKNVDSETFLEATVVGKKTAKRRRLKENNNPHEMQAMNP